MTTKEHKKLLKRIADLEEQLAEAKAKSRDPLIVGWPGVLTGSDEEYAGSDEEYDETNLGRHYSINTSSDKEGDGCTIYITTQEATSEAEFEHVYRLVRIAPVMYQMLADRDLTVELPE